VQPSLSAARFAPLDPPGVMSSRSRAEGESPPILGVTMWWECVELSPHHFRAAQAHALASGPEMALSRQDVYSAAHCIIRPLLLFRKWEDVSRAIIGVTM